MNFYSSIFAFLFLMVSLSTKGLSSGYPFWGYNLRNDHYIASETRVGPHNVHRLKVKWEFRTHRDLPAFPTIKGDDLYITDMPYNKPTAALHPFRNSGRLYALNRHTGQKIWSRTIRSYSRSLANNFSRNSPAIEGDKIVLGDSLNLLNLVLGKHRARARVFAVNRFTGKLIWRTTVENHFASQITQSPVIYNGVVYVGVSSQEEILPRFLGRFYHCCTFRGSMVALDLETGRILWKTYMTPDHFGSSAGYSGVAVWGSSPAIDPKRGLVYIGTGNNYDVPLKLKKCMKESGEDERKRDVCLRLYEKPGNFTDSVVALDLKSGEVRWKKQVLSYDNWNLACSPSAAPWYPGLGGCPRPSGPDADFAQAPMLITTESEKDLLVIGQKNGMTWALDPDQKGEIVWATRVGPGGIEGGHQWGSASDGKTVYTQITNFQHKEAELVAGLSQGKVINGGLWAALEASTGKILWQTPVPASVLPLKGEGLHHYLWGKNLGRGFFATAMGPLTLANGVLYAGSMDGHMYALDGESGKILWSFKTRGSVNSAPSVVDGVLYWGSGYEKSGFTGKRLYAFEVTKDH